MRGSVWAVTPLGGYFTAEAVPGGSSQLPQWRRLHWSMVYKKAILIWGLDYPPDGSPCFRVEMSITSWKEENLKQVSRSVFSMFELFKELSKSSGQ